MLIFAKDISQRDFIHSAEDQDPEIKKYMDYQRCLFPYTIIRGGLDLAYKEVDDILNYLDKVTNHQAILIDKNIHRIFLTGIKQDFHGLLAS